VEAGLPLERRRELLLGSMGYFRHWTGAPEADAGGGQAAADGREGAGSPLAG
jgi:hypothetical protein